MARQDPTDNLLDDLPSGKTGEMEISVPRDRNGAFELESVKKHQRRLPGFDDKVVALYARGLATREITGHLKDLYGVEVSPSLISAVTDTVIDDAVAWQSRPLDAVYPIVYLDAIHPKMRAEGQCTIRRSIWLWGSWGSTWRVIRSSWGVVDRRERRLEILAGRVDRA